MKSSDVILVKGDATEEKAKSTLFVILVIIGAVAAIAGIAYAVYSYLTPDFLDDFDDDFDDFDDYDDRFHQQMKLTMVLLPYIHRKIWKMLLKL